MLLNGREVFGYFCADCHGLAGRGVPGRGLDLVASGFVGRLSDAELAEFVRRGRAVGDPANRSGLPMLGMESFAAFAVVGYLRQLNRTGR